MKRDMKLARAILKTLEENKSPYLSEFDIEGALKDEFDVSNRGVRYQLNLLADANLVRSMGSDWQLTWTGHDFLTSATPVAFETPRSTGNAPGFRGKQRAPRTT